MNSVEVVGIIAAVRVGFAILVASDCCIDDSL